MAVRAALGAAPRRLCDGGDLAESCRRVDVPTLIVDGTADIPPGRGRLAGGRPAVGAAGGAGGGRPPAVGRTSVGRWSWRPTRSSIRRWPPGLASGGVTWSW